jgi:hypothetical protein
MSRQSKSLHNFRRSSRQQVFAICRFTSRAPSNAARKAVLIEPIDDPQLYTWASSQRTTNQAFSADVAMTDRNSKRVFEMENPASAMRTPLILGAVHNVMTRGEPAFYWAVLSARLNTTAHWDRGRPGRAAGYAAADRSSCLSRRRASAPSRRQSYESETIT